MGAVVALEVVLMRSPQPAVVMSVARSRSLPRILRVDADCFLMRKRVGRKSSRRAALMGDAVAFLRVVMVTVKVPLVVPGGMRVGLMEAVAPVGRPVMVRVIGLLRAGPMVWVVKV